MESSCSRIVPAWGSNSNFGFAILDWRRRRRARVSARQRRQKDPPPGRPQDGHPPKGEGCRLGIVGGPAPSQPAPERAAHRRLPRGVELGAPMREVEDVNRALSFRINQGDFNIAAMVSKR
jgi:hypothetical protein